jgi:hypothetical protein
MVVTDEIKVWTRDEVRDNPEDALGVMNGLANELLNTQKMLAQCHGFLLASIDDLRTSKQVEVLNAIREHVETITGETIEEAEEQRIVTLN